jgi:hypothetical protein
VDSATGAERSLLFIGSSLPYPPSGGSAVGAPSWRPDGQRLVVTGGTSNNPALYFVNPDGTNLTPLSFTGLDRAYGASYSPDGTKLVFVGDSAGTRGIYVVPVDTLTARRRVAVGSSCWGPMWSPTGQAIVYRCYGSGPGIGGELWVVGATGSAPAPTRYRSDFQASDLSWAPVVRSLPASLPPTGQIVGRAVDAANQTSLSGVRVDYRLSGGGPAGYPRYTDGNGNYTITGLEADTFDLIFSKDGYAGDSILNVVVTGGATTTPRNAQLRSAIGAPGLERPRTSSEGGREPMAGVELATAASAARHAAGPPGEPRALTSEAADARSATICGLDAVNGGPCQSRRSGRLLDQGEGSRRRTAGAAARGISLSTRLGISLAPYRWASGGRRQ